MCKKWWIAIPVAYFSECFINRTKVLLLMFTFCSTACYKMHMTGGSKGRTQRKEENLRGWSGNSLLWILPREVNGEGPDALVPEKALAESSCEWCFNQNNSGLLSVTVQRMRNDNEWYTFTRIREYVVGNFSASLSRYPQTKPTIYSISRYAGKSRGRGYVPPDKWRKQVGVNK